MNATQSKMPTGDRALVRDPDLNAALEKELSPLAGDKLEKAQAAIRELRGSGLMGTFGEVLAAYQAAIKKAVDAVELAEKERAGTGRKAVGKQSDS